ncbi:MAG TPA: FxsA family protein [Solirubrobacteraceae bacterium]|nr:FxsA family protein [Solirubrobacteraceae bacterium]
MILVLVLLFIVVPIAELYVIIQVGQEIGALPTVAILVADSIVGSLLLRSQGRQAWRRFNQATAAGRVPAREVLDGAMVIFGGAFLITPGFLTDVVGLLLLIPPTRAVARRMLVGVFSRRFVVSAVGRARGRRADHVDGTAVEVDSPPLPPPERP